MRVLQVVHGFPPPAAAGTEIYVWHLSRALAALPGVRVSVLTREADPNRPEYSVRSEEMSERTGRLSVFRINNTFQACTSFEDSYANPALAAVARGLIDRIEPDVVHVQHLTCLSTGILEHASAARCPVVMTLNDYWLMCQRGQLLRRDGRRCDGPFDRGCDGCVPRGVLAGPTAYRAGRIARTLPLPGAAFAARTAAKCLELTTSAEDTREASWKRLQHLRQATRGVDLFLAPSATMEEWALRFGIERARLERCDQGIDVLPFARSFRREAVMTGRLRLAFAGSLIPSKAPHLLLEAVDALPPGRITVDLLGTLAPYHGETSYATRVAPLLGKPFVRKLGPVPHERVPDAFADVDALVVPSEWIENAPFVIREAFAAGLPVIASSLGGMAEMVRHEHDGLLFAPGDSAALASAISRLLDEPELLDRLRQGIRRPMSIEEDAAQTLVRYERLCETRSNPRPASVPDLPTNERCAEVHGVVLNYRTADQAWLAARSIETSTIVARVLVVDNASGDGSVERLSSVLPAARVIDTGTNLGFSGGCNVGIRAALDEGARFVLLVNSDAVLAPRAIETLLNAARTNPAAGILAPVLLSREEPDRIASAGIRYSTATGRMRHIAAGQPLSLIPPGAAHPVDAVSGCVMLIRRDVFDAVGYFDEEFFFSFEDIEFCLRARRHRFRVLCVPGALAYHEGGRSIGRTSPDRVYFAARNHLRIARMTGNGHGVSWLRGGLIVGLNAGYVLLSGDTPRIRGFGALARGVWHHLGGRYGPA
jgi:GT2 family glycosyltransferase/glycosyltransferase involved in cell wall biosynthesis